MRGLLLVAVLMLPGCRSVTHTQINGPVVPATELPRVLSGMQERSDMLQRLHGWGIVELRWTDAEGAHFEQGDMDFWMDGPDRLAVRISKLGDSYFWMGTDGTDAWIFDLFERPRRLMVDSMAKVRAAGQQRPAGSLGGIVCGSRRCSRRFAEPGAQRVREARRSSGDFCVCVCHCACAAHMRAVYI